MPSNHSTRRRDTISGTAKLPEDEQYVLLFGFIALHECGTALAETLPSLASKRRGQRAQYPPTALLAMLGCARVSRSLSAAIKALHSSPELWQRCRNAYQARSGISLPLVPPSRDQVEYFRNRLVGNPDTMTQLQRTFRRTALGQARMLGNLLVGVTPDWSQPQETHAIYGDGTHIARYSDVREVYDPRSDTHVLVGSRATTGKPRIQRRVTASGEDGKEGKVVTGLNMVSMHTWTRAGRVTLGTALAARAEQWAALELTEDLAELAGDGIHTLIYDRAITGWTVDYLMADLRIQVIGKAVGARAEQNAHAKTTDADLKDLVDRRLAELDAKPTTDLHHLLRRDALADMLRYHERQPLGTCIYPNSRSNFDLVRSSTAELEPVRHTSPAGDCVHRIALDDGGLYEIDEHEDGAYDIKTRVLRCTSSTPYQRPDGRWGTRSEYLIPCANGDVTYQRTWEPDGTRHTPESPEKDRSPTDTIGWRLRPLSRADDLASWYNSPDPRVDHSRGPRPFTDVYGRRNDAESFNEWYQQTLRHHGRATSLDPVAQELDFLMGALLNNAITWHHR